MRNVRKRPAMYESRIVFQRLHKVRLHCVFQENGHRTVGLDVARKHGRAVAAIGDNHVAQTLLQVLQVLGEAKDRHNFGGDCDVETGFARETVGHTAKAGRDLAQGAVVHVDHTTPNDPADVDLQFVAPIDVVIDHCRQQRMRGSDRVEVACKVQVHLFHRHNLRVAAARGATLHTKVGPKRGFADTHTGILANTVQAVTQTYCRRCLTFTCRCRVDRCHKDQLSVRTILNRVDE